MHNFGAAIAPDQASAEARGTNYRMFSALACHRSTEEPTAFCVIRPMPRTPFKDALLSAYMHSEQFKGRAQISTWLNAIVNNSARTHLRTRRR
jgi:hypothetical protein